MSKLSRLEANKEARRILNRNGVNLSYAQYSVCGREIRLTGWLCHNDSSHFSAHEIQLIIQDCNKVLPGFLIAGDFENWKFSSDFISEQKGNSGDEDQNEDNEAERYSIEYEAP